MGMGFTNREEPQEREGPTQHVCRSPRPRAPAPAFHPPAKVSPPRLVLGAQMGLRQGLEPSLQMLAVQEGLQVTLQAWTISSRLQAKQTSLQALLRPPSESTARPASPPGLGSHRTDTISSCSYEGRTTRAQRLETGQSHPGC